jgi:hypothetical protein
LLFRSNVQSRNEYELKRYFLRKVEKKVRVKQQTNVQLPNKCDLKISFSPHKKELASMHAKSSTAT